MNAGPVQCLQAVHVWGRRPSGVASCFLEVHGARAGPVGQQHLDNSALGRLKPPSRSYRSL
eukprot:15452127-Alexandrium_andersonii.AAC.1